MILSVQKSIFLSNVKDFIKHFGNDYLEKNAHLYEEHIDIEELMDDLLTTYFADYKGTCSIVKINGGWLVTIYEIPYVIVHKDTIIPCNSRAKSEALFNRIAKKVLRDDPTLKAYPKDKIDYSVYEGLVKTTNVKLFLFGSDKNLTTLKDEDTNS